jgi:predicted glycoside hydrolase/deacetylase ChbG (UPF0249 family)
MVPCPGYREVVTILKENCSWDVGIHLTLTSEWPTYKWLPLTSSEERNVHRHDSDWFPAQTRDLQYFEAACGAEIALQVSKAKDDGIRPSHVDSHMFAMLTAERVPCYLSVARQHALTPMLARRHNGCLVDYGIVDESIPMVDYLWYATPEIPAGAWLEYHLSLIDRFGPGLNELLVHPGFADSELMAITGSKSEWGADWRQRDYDIISSEIFKNELKRRGVILVSWAEAVALHAIQKI